MDVSGIHSRARGPVYVTASSWLGVSSSISESSRCQVHADGKQSVAMGPYRRSRRQARTIHATLAWGRGAYDSLFLPPSWRARQRLRELERDGKLGVGP